MARRILDLDTGWTAAATRASVAATPDEAAAQVPADGWLPARVPGTAAAALADAGAWTPGDPERLDDEDWWFRTTFAADPAAPGERLVLRLDGVATLSETFLNGERVAACDSMFAAQAIDVTDRVRAAENELWIRCAALTPRLRERRKPRARWRTMVVAEGNLRWVRTAVLGRAPGFAPGPAPVGPWRPVRLERSSGVVVEDVALRPRVDGGTGVLAVRVAVSGAGADAQVVLRGPSGTHRAPLVPSEDGDGALTAELRVPDVALWWPHTHGDPVLHDVALEAAGETLPLGRTGFRTLRFAEEVERDGLDLHVNGVPVFARGAVWSPADAVSLAPGPERLRRSVERAREAGMNLLRVVGTAVYEEPAFHDLCDELGILVWQDLMFANMDYPVADPDFRAQVEAEADAVLAQVGGRPSLAVVCGNSEIEQQAAMLGLAPEAGRGELFGTVLPARVAAARIDAAWVPSAPCGGVLPFRVDTGIANYFGVGGYRRGLDDVRRAGVRFAAECLAFANVPDQDAVDALLPDTPAAVVVHHPRWKAGVPRDHGSGWDFEDVRDHYLRELYAVDPGELRRVDHGRYLDLSRAVSGELMAEVLGEWRRAASPCRGALVLWWHDLLPGAGWGLLDHRGEPKVAYHHVRRALAPIAVWTTDEGMNGIAVHAANDTPAPVRATLRVALYREDGRSVETAEEELTLPAHGGVERDVEALVGRFVDASWAFRFGPPGHEAVVASLRDADGAHLSSSVRFPAARPTRRVPAAGLGVEVAAEAAGDGAVDVRIAAAGLLHGARLRAPGWDGDDDAFCVEPGVARTVRLRPREAGAAWPGAALTALNLDGRVAVPKLASVGEGVA